jgi:ADP-ribose pyrophosphatase YjhB (NUDIX family)
VSGRRSYPDRPLLGVGAVVFRGDDVLLIERGTPPLKGWWTVPGGMVEAGERLEEAVVREVREETGLLVRPVKVAALFERIMRDPEGRTQYHYVIVDYLCELLDGTLQAASDVAAASWAPVSELGMWKVAPGTPPVIARALEMTK